MEKIIYLDNASTTKCSKVATNAIIKANEEDFFNPSAKYMQAVKANKKLDECRTVLLDLVGANKREYKVVFTGSASEGNNLVLNSMLSKHYPSVVSVGEHASVYETAKHFITEGRLVIFAPLNEKGEVDAQKLLNLITKETRFLSFMLVSNETGAISSAKSIIASAKKISPKLLVHIDAVQAFCKIPFSMEDLGVDYITVSSHKVHGPKGVGAVVFNKNCKLEAEIFGGGQEGGKRSGTENLPCILGFVESAKMLKKDIKTNYQKVKEFKEVLCQSMKQNAENNGIKMLLNGSMEDASPYVLSVSFPGYKGEVILHSLERENILVGTGSACNSNHSGNRVLENMGRTKQEIEGNIRLSFSIETATSFNPIVLSEKIINTIKKINK